MTEDLRFTFKIYTDQVDVLVNGDLRGSLHMSFGAARRLAKAAQIGAGLDPSVGVYVEEVGEWRS